MDTQTISQLIVQYGTNIGIVLATLSILIVIHEWGHFYAAKLSGVSVLEFSFGMGTKLWEREWHGTKYQIRLIPMGGFIRMAGDEMQRDGETYLPSEFFGASLKNRFMIVSAGPLMNLFLTCVLYFSCFFFVSQNVTRPVVGFMETNSPALQGGLQSEDIIQSINGRKIKTFEDFATEIASHPHKTLAVEVLRGTETVVLMLTPKESKVQNILGEDEVSGKLGVYPVTRPVIASVIEDSPAALLGLEKGDRITHLNGQRVQYWEEVSYFIKSNPDKMVEMAWVSINNTAHTKHFKVTAKEETAKDNTKKTVGYLGVGVAYNPDMIFQMRLEFFPAVKRVFAEIKTQIYYTLKGLMKIVGGDVTKDSVMGPVRIVDLVIDVAETGFFPWLYFVGLISLQLFFFNLLPFPALDGGYILFFTIEAICRRPLPVKVLDYANRFGFVTLITLLLFVVYNDITHIF